jgi:hypothetical protein
LHTACVLILAAISVAGLHAVLPDHWMPVALVARAERWPLGHTLRVGIWTGVGHGIGSPLSLARQAELEWPVETVQPDAAHRHHVLSAHAIVEVRQRADPHRRPALQGAP